MRWNPATANFRVTIFLCVHVLLWYRESDAALRNILKAARGAGNSCFFHLARSLSLSLSLSSTAGRPVASQLTKGVFMRMEAFDIEVCSHWRTIQQSVK